jgi:hypothetical protein
MAITNLANVLASLSHRGGQTRIRAGGPLRSNVAFIFAGQVRITPPQLTNMHKSTDRIISISNPVPAGSRGLLIVLFLHSWICHVISSMFVSSVRHWRV